MIADAVSYGAQIVNISFAQTVTGGYTDGSAIVDRAVRDADTSSARLEPIIMVLAAGNRGGSRYTIDAPHEVKNGIVVGDSLTWLPGSGFPSDNINGVSGSSGRGPAFDERILPTVVAPGTDVASALSQYVADPGNAAIPNTGNLYTFKSGTSMATPHVAGMCALLIEWWQQRTGRSPSPAMLKALLVSGAVDMGGGENWRSLNLSGVDKDKWKLNSGHDSGHVYKRSMEFKPATVLQGDQELTRTSSASAITSPGQWFYDEPNTHLYVRMSDDKNPKDEGASEIVALDNAPLEHIPNPHQGWGRVSTNNIINQSPASDRGLRVFSDQRHAFTANDQEYLVRVTAADESKPLRITLAWTDVPGPILNASEAKALINDLDLEVRATGTGQTYQGNHFADGFSHAGGDTDDTNNLECVYIQRPQGSYEIRVLASHIDQNALLHSSAPWQDFALVIENAVPHSEQLTAVAAVIDRSGSMRTSGYIDITKQSTQLFLDLLNPGDQCALVSFGTTGKVEYSSGTGLVTIERPIDIEAANGAAEGIRFGGWTYMGDGLRKAGDLFGTTPGALVLLSDGYDNKGGRSSDSNRPSAVEAAAALSNTLRIYSCAMGPASDQALLETLARQTSGLYFYMPTIDDLTEIYNCIRAAISGDALIVNESSMASSSRVAAVADAQATRLTFAVAWPSRRLRYVAHEPTCADEVSVRLRSPRGQLLPVHASYVHRVTGPGYVSFTLHDPLPGRWYVEVTTFESTHTRYTVGGFVRSPLRMHIVTQPVSPVPGNPFDIAVQVFDGDTPITGYTTTARVVYPRFSLATLLRKYRFALDRMPIGKSLEGDATQKRIQQLVKLRRKLLQDGGEDIFAHQTAPVQLRYVTNDILASLGFDVPVLPGSISGVPGGIATHASPLMAPGTVRSSTGLTGQFGVPNTQLGSFGATANKGTYNVLVEASGVSPVTGARFVRKALKSVRVG